ncbi:MAG: hypothetical protein WA715_26070 [Candidatus Acidiferrum sp.]
MEIVGNVIWQELQRDKAAKPRVFRLVHHTHAAATEFFNDAVVGDGLTEERVGVRHLATS